MEIKFYHCSSCHRLDEYNRLMANKGCICGAMRVQPAHASTGDLIWFCIKHPSYLIKALKGEKLYD